MSESNEYDPVPSYESVIRTDTNAGTGAGADGIDNMVVFGCMIIGGILGGISSDPKAPYFMGMVQSMFGAMGGFGFGMIWPLSIPIASVVVPYVYFYK